MEEIIIHDNFVKMYLGSMVLNLTILFQPLNQYRIGLITFILELQAQTMERQLMK